MNIEMNKMTFNELQTLLDTAIIEIKGRILTDEKELQSKKEFLSSALERIHNESIQKQVKTHGLTGRKVPPKYRSKDGQKAWSGRGIKPRWVREYLANSGSKLEDLLIKKC